MTQADDAAHALARLWDEFDRTHYQLGLAVRDVLELLDGRPPQKEEERISR